MRLFVRTAGDPYALVPAVTRIIRRLSANQNMRLPGTLPVLIATTILAFAAILATLMPATKASRVDVLQALRSE